MGPVGTAWKGATPAHDAHAAAAAAHGGLQHHRIPRIGRKRLGLRDAGDRAGCAWHNLHAGLDGEAAGSRLVAQALQDDLGQNWLCMSRNGPQLATRVQPRTGAGPTGVCCRGAVGAARILWRYM